MSATVEKFMSTKRRKYAQQRQDEVLALEQNVQAAIARTAQLTERERDTTNATIKVRCRVLARPHSNTCTHPRKMCNPSTATSNAWRRSLSRCAE